MIYGHNWLSALLVKKMEGYGYYATPLRSSRNIPVFTAWLIFCCITVQSMAAVYSGGDGSLSTPYLIATPQDLLDLGNPLNSLDWDKYFQMNTDIDMNGVTGFSPIGNSTTNFTGNFDGNGYTIQNLTIDQSTNDNVGLFGYTSGVDCQVTNVGIVNGIIFGNGVVGALAGRSNGTISNCYAMATVTGYRYLGVLVGLNGGTIIDSHSSGTVSGTNNFIGGLSGWNSGTISSCYSESAASGSRNVGGLVGTNRSVITSCYATGIVNAIDANTGGLVGNNENATAIVEACYATGNVTSTSYGVGGLVGGNSSGVITACYATGEVSGGNIFGGLVGNTLSGKPALLSFWDMESSGEQGSSGGKRLTTSQMKTVSTFQNAGWGSYPWVMVSDEYPRLAWEATGFPAIPAPELIPLSGDGTIGNPYLVGTPEEFLLLSWRPEILTSYILLTADIDCTGQTVWPIGDLGGEYTGFFDGAGYVISNAVVDYVGGDFIGLFSWIGAGGTVTNLGIVDCPVTGREYVGGLTAVNYGSVLNCYVTSNVSSTLASVSRVGGLIGSNNGNVTHCYAQGTVSGTGNSVGGLLGAHSNGTIMTSYASGNVLGPEGYVGGLVGIKNSGTLTDCFATGDVSGGWRVGGLLGYNNSTGITSRCYAVGFVSGDTSVGGLLGYGTVPTVSFWDISIGSPDNGLGTGLPTSQMQQQSTFDTVGWDFTGPPPVWTIEENISYPNLWGLPAPPIAPEIYEWPTANGIIYGQFLADAMLIGGTASVPGTFSFDFPDIVPMAGTTTYGVTFTPDDSLNYKSVGGTVSVTVDKAVPDITTWPTASNIVYGQTLSDSVLTGGIASITGTFVFTDETISPDVGVYSASVTFFPDDAPNYYTVVGSVLVTIEEIIEGEEEVFSLLYTGTNPIMATAGERINITVIPQHQNGTVTYQWYQITPDKSLLSLPWATNDTIVFESVTVQDAGNYQCMATDMVANSAQSPVITLVVDSGMPLSNFILLFLLTVIVSRSAIVRLKYRS